MLVAIWIVVARSVRIGGLFPFTQTAAIAMLGVAVAVWMSLFAERYDLPWPVTAVLSAVCVLAGTHVLPITGGLGLVGLVKSR